MFYEKRGQKESIKMTDEYFSLLKEATKNETELIERIANIPTLLELYEKVDESMIALLCESINIYYVEGLKFGISLGMEVAEEN